MDKESRIQPLSTRMLTYDELDRARLKLMNVSITNLQMKPKEVPHNYKNASLVLKFMKNHKLNLHEAIDKVTDKKKELGTQIEDLVRLTLDHEEEINFLIKKVGIFDHCLDLDPFMIKVVTAELMWNRLYIKFNTMDTIYLRYHEADMREAFVETTMLFKSSEDSYTSDLPVYVRINTLAISIEASINAFYEEGWNLLQRPSTYLNFLNDLTYLQGKNCMRDFHISELLVFPAGTSFYQHPGFLEGKFFIQDKGSCLATFLLNPKPGSRVLDMCAAPGFKTNHIANMIRNEGMIYACDRHPDRYNKLCSLMDLTNVTCVEPIHDDHFNIEEINGLNYILLDAPSSYSGIFHKKDITGLHSILRYFQHKSSNMLRYALQNFPSVKRVVYTACSMYADEGERVVADALRDIGNAYTLLDVREMLWNEWTTVGYEQDYPFAGKCLRIQPEFDLSQGCFIAVFERNFSEPVPPYIKSRKYKCNPPIADIPGSTEQNSDVLKIGKKRNRTTFAPY